MPTLRPLVALACAVIVLAACSEAPVQLETRAGPVTLDIVSGDAQIGVAGAELPAALKVRAVVGTKKLAGLLVNFRVIDGGGRMYAGAAITDRDGLAQDYWTLGNTIGPVQRVEVVAVDPSTGAKQNFGAFTARGAASAAPKLESAPTSVDFGSTNVGTSTATTTLTLTNMGAASATGLTVAVAGSGAAAFEATANTCAGATLAFTQTCTVDVRFNPAVEGALTATLTVTPTTGSAASVPLQGVAIGTPQLGIAPSTIDFGSLAVGSTSATQLLTISNAGNGSTGSLDVQLTGTHATQFQVVTDQCTGVALAPTATCSIGVRFQPSLSGGKVATLAVSGTPGGSVSSTLTGTGAAAILQFTPPSYNFGFVYPGSIGALRTFTLSNVGTLQSGPIGFSLANPADFSIESHTCTTLAVGASCQVIVQFLPRSTGTFNTQLAASASPGGTTYVALTGTGTGQVLATLTPTMGFGSVVVGSASNSQSLTLTNTGNGSIPTGTLTTLLAGVNPGDFAIVTNNCAGASLNPGQGCTILLRFQPTAIGARAAQLQAYGANGPSVGVNLTGNGVNAAVLSLAPASANFGSIAVGTNSPPQSFTLTNTGNASSGLLATAITGANANDFSIVASTCAGTTLAVGATCTVDVAFAPGSSGARSATLAVQGAPGEAASATLAGTGLTTGPFITVSPTSADMQTFAGVSTGANFTVSNTGASPTSVGFSFSGSDAARFSIGTNTCTASLNPGTSCSVTVNFLSAVPGSFVAQLNVLSSAPTVVVPLTATVR